MISSFQFLSYKIDKMSLEIDNKMHNLLKNYCSEDDWAFAVGIRHPVYVVPDRIYIGGIDIEMYAGTKESPDVSLRAGIAGAFRVVGEDIPPAQEEKVAKIQVPALLSPYLRAGISGVLALSGFGSVVLPLFNFNKLAEEQLKDVEIERVGQEHLDEIKANDSTSN